MTTADEAKMTDSEERETQRRSKLRAPVVYSMIQREGEEELERRSASLFWSAIAAGIVMSTSVLAEGILHHYIPEAQWKDAVVHAGYCVGFLIVVLGRMQLFTENTITVVLPVVNEFTKNKIREMVRVWGIVFFANMIGIGAAMALLSSGWIANDNVIQGMIAVSRPLLDRSFLEILGYGVPAGFLVAALVWILPNAKESQFAVIVLVTYMIAMGGFSHVVAGSGEAFLLVFIGEATWGFALFQFMIPALIGNIIGGTGLFAMLAYGQVRGHLREPAPPPPTEPKDQ